MDREEAQAWIAAIGEAVGDTARDGAEPDKEAARFFWSWGILVAWGCAGG